MPHGILLAPPADSLAPSHLPPHAEGEGEWHTLTQTRHTTERTYAHQTGITSQPRTYSHQTPNRYDYHIKARKYGMTITSRRAHTHKLQIWYHTTAPLYAHQTSNRYHITAHLYAHQTSNRYRITVRTYAHHTPIDSALKAAVHIDYPGHHRARKRTPHCTNT